MSTAGPGGLFSVPAFFIVFRETLEAAIVVSVLLNVLKKTKLTKLNKHVWSGILFGLVLTTAMMVAAIYAFNFAADSFLEGLAGGNNQTDEEEAQFNASLRLRASLSLSAAILIALMCWTLDGILHKQKEIEQEMLNETKEAVKKKDVVTWWTIFLLSFTTVTREGAETVIFLAVATGFDLKSIPIPLVTGLLAGTIAGVLFYKAGSKMALVWFFRISVVFLAFVGAGIFAHGLEEIFQLKDGLEGGLGWWGEIVYNISYCCGLRFEGYQLFRALFGYTPYPSRLEMIGYFAYHFTLVMGFVVKWQFRKRNLNPGEYMKKAIKKKLGFKVEEDEEKDDEDGSGEDTDEDKKQIEEEEGQKTAKKSEDEQMLLAIEHEVDRELKDLKEEMKAEEEKEAVEGQKVSV